MIWPFAIAAAALTVALVLALLQPFLTRTPELWLPAGPHAVRNLVARKERLLGALKELELDHGMGKISAPEYARARAELEGAALRTLAQLEDVQQARGMDRIRSQVEADVEAVRQQLSAAAASLCAGCGAPRAAADPFCSRCGMRHAT